MTPSEVETLVKNLERTGDLPASVPQSTLAEVSKSLARYFNQVSADKVKEFTEKARKLIEDALNTEQIDTAEAMRKGQTVTVGESRGTARADLLDFLHDNGQENIGATMDLDFFLRIPMEVAAGAAGKLAQNWDADRVQAYPALELRRVYERDVPRGSEKDPEGETNGWDTDGGRWEAATDESGDEDAAKVFEDTGRMVALKSSGVWQSLGNGAGDYSDTLGNDFPPFAYNSGYDVDEVTREEAEELGLLDQGEEVEMPELDLADLIPSM